MSYTPRSLLVTGGAGFIGSSFVRQAVALGDQVIVLDALTYAGHKINLEHIQGPGNCTLVEGTICDGNLVLDLLHLHQIDAIVHFAAESHVDNSILSPAAFIETNIVGSYTLLEAARRYTANLPRSTHDRFRLIHVSTDEVYGSLGKEGYFTETSPIRPNSPYSASKAASDLLARAWFHTYDLPTIITNCSNNYGPRQHPEKLIPHMIECALQNKPLPIYGTGLNIRDWIHVEDHTRGIRLALDKGRPGEVYCFGGHAEMTNLDLVTMLCTLLDSLQPRIPGGSYRDLISFVSDRPGHDLRYAIDDQKAEQELGFSRQYDVSQGLRMTVSWYLDHRDWMQAQRRFKTV